MFCRVYFSSVKPNALSLCVNFLVTEGSYYNPVLESETGQGSMKIEIELLRTSDVAQLAMLTQAVQEPWCSSLPLHKPQGLGEGAGAVASPLRVHAVQL